MRKDTRPQIIIAAKPGKYFFAWDIRDPAGFFLEVTDSGEIYQLNKVLARDGILCNDGWNVELCKTCKLFPLEI